VDIVSTMTPLTKLAHQIVSPATIPSMVREAFRVAQQERPGPVHLELPEDIAREAGPDMSPVPSHPIDPPVAPRAALERAAELILKAERPLVMLGAAASRPRLAEALSAFVRRVQIPVLQHPNGQGGRRSCMSAICPPRSRRCSFRKPSSWATSGPASRCSPTG
jgi:acetolactate synthase I/II/III large subunit